MILRQGQEATQVVIVQRGSVLVLRSIQAKQKQKKAAKEDENKQITAKTLNTQRASIKNHIATHNNSKQTAHFRV